jgi:sec-independent protein translocase protein TatA
MNAMLSVFGMGGGELLVVLCALLILFGAKKIPEFAKGMGQGIKEFKKATREVSDELNSAMEDHPAPPQKKVPAATVPTEAAPSAAPSQPGQKV